MKTVKNFKKGFLSLSLVLSLTLPLFTACNKVQNAPVPSATSMPASVASDSTLSTVTGTDTPGDESGKSSQTSGQLAAGVGADAYAYLDSESDNAAYLAYYYNLTAEKYDAAAFAEALSKVSGDEAVNAQDGETYLKLAADLKEDFSFANIVKALVTAGGNFELAQTYDHQKALAKLETCLNDKKITAAIDEALYPYLATAVDCNLLNADLISKLLVACEQSSVKNLDAALADALLMRVNHFSGVGRQILTNSLDYAAGSKLVQAWNNFILLDQTTLSALGNKAVKEKVVTGFNVKTLSYSSKFLPARTLRYGHSDIKHALQLVNLLRSENINVLINLEPKVSLFEYLLDWGPIPEPTPGYRVEKYGDDFYVAAALEYDLELEFLNNEDMHRFDSLIKKYAKKSGEDASTDGLLYSSWWQPLYSSIELVDKDSYREMVDCIVTQDNYVLHTFCLPDNADKVADFLQSNADKAATFKRETRYADTAFINYLEGSDYQ